MKRVCISVFFIRIVPVAPNFGTLVFSSYISTPIDPRFTPWNSFDLAAITRRYRIIEITVKIKTTTWHESRAKGEDTYS